MRPGVRRVRRSIPFYGSSCSFWHFRPIPVCPLGHRVRQSIPVRGLVMGRSLHSRTPRGSLEIVKCIQVCSEDRWVRSVHSRAPWLTSRSFGCGCSIPVRSRGLRVRSGAFGSFPCALAVMGFVRVRSVHSWWWSGSLGCVLPIPVRHGVRSCAFCPFPRTIGFVRVRSVHYSAPWASSDSFYCVQMRHGYRWFRSGTFRPFPFRPGCGRVRLCALSPFPYALKVPGVVRLREVQFVRARLVHSSAPWCSLWSICSIPIRPGGRRVSHSRAPWWLLGSLGCVRPIPVRHGVRYPYALVGRRVLSAAFGPFPCALGVEGCVGPFSLGSSGSFWLFFDPFSCALEFIGCVGPFLCALEIVGFVRVRSHLSSTHWVSLQFVQSIPVCAEDHWVRSVHSRAPLGSSGSVGCGWSIPARSRRLRVRSCALCSFPCALSIVGFVRAR